MLEKLLFNLASGKSQLRYETLEGREHVVVPMVMITEGVFDGSGGPLYYPSTELAKTPVVWNHKPIVVVHPEVNGQAVSACDPVVLESRKVGVILNTRWDEKTSKLRAEAWMEKSRLSKVDERILDAIENGKKVEVSTGLYTDNDDTPGVWNGKNYSAVARNYRPDHLAILPDGKGACSIADGAGLLANQERQKSYTSRERRRLIRKGHAMPDGSFIIANADDIAPALALLPRAATPASVKLHIMKRAEELGKLDIIPPGWKITANEASFSQIHRSIMDQLAAKHGEPGKSWYGYIEDIYPSQVIYCTGEGGMYSQEYTVDSKGVVTLKGDPVAVKRVNTYQAEDGGTVVNSATTNEGKKMPTKAERVSALITANVGWSEGEKQFLLDMPDEKFAIIEKNATIPTPTPAPTPAPVVPPPVVQPTPAPVGNGQALTAEQYIAQAPPAIAALLANGLAAHKAEKERLVGIITANAANRFTKEHLETMSLDELQGIAALAAPVATAPVLQNQQRPLFMGAAGPAPTQPVVEEKPLPLPVINYGK